MEIDPNLIKILLFNFNLIGIFEILYISMTNSDFFFFHEQKYSCKSLTCFAEFIVCSYLHSKFYSIL